MLGPGHRSVIGCTIILKETSCWSETHQPPNSQSYIQPVCPGSKYSPTPKQNRSMNQPIFERLLFQV